MTLKNLLLLLLIPLYFTGCSDSGTPALSDSEDESAQQLGDTMASIDESGGSDGTMALQNTFEKTFQRLSPNNFKLPFWKRAFTINEADAASCFVAHTFGTCGATDPNVIVRDFNDCTILGATFSGTVTLSWASSNTDCTLAAQNDTITRVPDFSVTGLRGATLTVSKSGTVGQVFTLTSDPLATTKTFSFTNDGIRRVFTLGSSTLFDFTTKVTDPITITGDTRANRVVDGGTLEVTNNSSSLSCDYTPSNVTWDSTTCNCAESGTWTGTCSDSTTRKVEITGCGTADVTVGSVTSSVTFDRCAKI